MLGFRRIRFNDEITIKGWQLYGLFFLLAPTIAFYFIFIRAFFRPSFSIMIAINWFGEAYIELVVATIIVIWGLIAIRKALKDHRKKYIKEGV